MVRDGSLVRIGFRNNVTGQTAKAIYVEMGKTHDGDNFGAWFPLDAVKVGPRGEIFVPDRLLYQHMSNVVEAFPQPKYRPWLG